MLRNIRIILGFSLSACAFDPLYAKPSPHKSSIHVMRLSDGKTILEENPDNLLCPASVTKLITAAAALTRMSPDYQFKTKFYADQPVAAGNIKGNLYIRGDGDPFIISEKLWQLGADLRTMGLRAISGNIVIDNSLFPDPVRDNSRTEGKERSNHAYDAPVSAFAVNFNNYAFAVSPAANPGAAATVAIDPYPIAGMKIKNTTKTGKSGGKPAIEITRQSSKTTGLDTLSASGSIPQDFPIKKIYRSVGDPVSASGEYIRSFLAAYGIKVSGKIVSGSLPDKAFEVYSLESYPMLTIVGGLNKFSNNFIADMLTQKMGAMFAPAETIRNTGAMAAGVDVLRNFLKVDVGIKSDFELHNGSGLDTRNRVSARQITTLLQYMDHRLDVFPEFLASLPAAGWDGTLEKRFKDKKTLAGRLRAKTGSLNDPFPASSLAGYMTTSSGERHAFAVILNAPNGGATIDDLQKVQETLISQF